jgi:hypothetical protein
VAVLISLRLVILITASLYSKIGYDVWKGKKDLSRVINSASVASSGDGTENPLTSCNQMPATQEQQSRVIPESSQSLVMHPYTRFSLFFFFAMITTWVC